MTCGIYKIANAINDKVYIGQSRSYERRRASHLNKLSKNKHENSHLQRSWNKYGRENFTVDLIEVCEIEVLTERENHWMNHYESFNDSKGYNKLMPSENNLSYAHSDSSKELLSKAKTVYTDEELIDILLDFYRVNNRVPTIRDLRKSKGYVSGVTYRNRFGSFKNALVISGLYDLITNKHDFDRVKMTEKDRNFVILKTKEFIKVHRRALELTDIDNDSDMPSRSSIFRMFGSMENLMNECGYSEQDFVNMYNENLLDGLKKLYIQDGMVTKNTISACSYTGVYSTYVKRFGKLSNAYKLAGIPVNQYGHPIPLEKVDAETKETMLE